MGTRVLTILFTHRIARMLFNVHTAHNAPVHTPQHSRLLTKHGPGLPGLRRHEQSDRENELARENELWGLVCFSPRFPQGARGLIKGVP